MRLLFLPDDGIVVVEVEKGLDEMDATAVPAALRERLGPDAASGLLDLLEVARREWSDPVIEACADRFERSLLEETSKLRLEIAQGDAALRQQLTELGASVRGEKTELGATLRGEMTELGATLRGEMTELGTNLRGEMTELGANLRGEMTELGASLRGEMKELSASVRGEMRELGAGLRLDMAGLGGSLRQEMSNLRFEILKWCFLFWVGQVVAVAGVFALMLRILRP